MIVDPLFEGSVHDTVTVPLALARAETFVGADGAAGMVTGLDGLDRSLVPDPLVAVTMKLYVVPDVKPVMVAEVTLDPVRLE